MQILNWNLINIWWVCNTFVMKNPLGRVIIYLQVRNKFPFNQGQQVWAALGNQSRSFVLRVSKKSFRGLFWVLRVLPMALLLPGGKTRRVRKPSVFIRSDVHVVRAGIKVKGCGPWQSRVFYYRWLIPFPLLKYPYRAKRGVSGALNLQSATAGPNPRLEVRLCGAASVKEYWYPGPVQPASVNHVRAGRQQH